MKFKVGDKVKYTGEYSSFVACNSTGVIIRQDDIGWDVLFSNGKEWWCGESNLVKSPSKNQQLLFSFMERS